MHILKLLFVIPIVIIIVICLNFFSGNSEVLFAGSLAPSFSLTDQDGNTHNLVDYKEKKLVVYFFPLADTPGWIKEACGFRNVYAEFEKNNITVIGISYDKPESLREFKDKYNLPFNFLSDRNKKVAKKFGANGLVVPKRMTFVIDGDGKIEKIYKKVNINTHAETILEDIIK